MNSYNGVFCHSMFHVLKIRLDKNVYVYLPVCLRLFHSVCEKICAIFHVLLCVRKK